MDKKYCIITYGCQMNVHESEKLAGVLSKQGYAKTEETKEADVIVFNTCCIRENAENHAFGNIGMLKKLKKEKPHLIIAVCGCMTQQKGKAEELHKKFPFVDIIFGTHNLNEFESLLIQKQKQKKALIKIDETEGDIIEDEHPLRTSYPNAWVNIMYGCNNFCSYCIVPYVRGRERSRKMENILAECKQLISEGYKEITLLGQNVNSYGNDFTENKVTFPELLDEICKIDGKFRLRFMTSHPKDFNEELIKVIAKNDKICNCVHLPVQAGNNRILKLMNRKYTADDYIKKVELLRKYIKGCAITSDLMIGFPTETEEEFLDTMELAKKVDFTSSFTFVYSRRSGTVACDMEGQVPEDVQKDRIMRLVALQNELTREASKKYLGKTVEILVEDYDEKTDLYQGRDENGRMGYFKADHNCVGEFVNIKITETAGVSLHGEIEKQAE